jgi:hypothetical protein
MPSEPQFPILLPSAANVLVLLGKLESEIANAKTLDEINDISVKTRAIQIAKRDVKDVSDRDGNVRVEAEAKLGEKLKEIPRARGTRGTLAGRDASGGSVLVPPENIYEEAPTLKQIGVEKKRSALAQKLAAIPKQKREEICKLLAENDKPVSPVAVVKAAIKERTAVGASPRKNPASKADASWKNGAADLMPPIERCILDVMEIVSECSQKADPSEWSRLFDDLRAELDHMQKTLEENHGYHPERKSA